MGRRLLSPFVGPAVLAGLAVLVASSSALAVGINDYGFKRTFTLPAAVPTSFGDGTVLLSALADGRLLAVNGNGVLRETAVGSGTFASLGAIGDSFAAPFGATFLSVSPDGSKAAIGNNNGAITVFNTATPSTATSFAVADFDAAWADSNRLAVSNYNGVQVLNTTSGAVTTAIGNVGGYSGGIAFDKAGNLYTGNGTDTAAGGSDTGYVKGFSKAAWEAAAAGGPAVNFETTGAVVADLLTASPIGFDATGNLFVGGGDFFSTALVKDNGYAALVDAAVVAQAFANGATLPPVDANSPGTILRKFASPQSVIDGAQSSIFSYNELTGELYLRYFQGNTVTVYAIPEPSALCGLLMIGVAGLRRRRRAIAGAAVVAIASSAQAYTYDANDFAVEVTAFTGYSGTGIYADPAAVLGRPTLKFNNGTAGNPDLHRTKLIEGTFNVGPDGKPVVTTVATGQSITVRMGRAVTDDPSHPFGIDFNVFGNAFFSPGSGFTSDLTNLNDTTLTGSIFTEAVSVSVSPDGNDWYTYTNGTTGDGYFPTNSYRWDRASATWSADELDPTKAVDPALKTVIINKTAGDMTAAGVLDLYSGAAGGAGFDLAESNFASIRFIRFDGTAATSLAGEIDAVAAVPEPALLGVASLLALVTLRRV